MFYKLYTKVDVFIYEFANNINMPYTIILQYKSNRTICILYRKFTDKGDIPVNNPNIHECRRKQWALEITSDKSTKVINF